MASRSTGELLRAIEGFTKEHKGSPKHEPMIDQLKRVTGEIAKGSSGGEDSPGRLAAASAAGTAVRDTMSSEATQPKGDGQKRSNEPGHAGAPDPLADIAGPDGRDDHLTGAAAVNSGGARRSNLPSTGLAPGTMEIRRIAAERERSRPDTHMTPGAHKPGDNNKKSNQPGDGYPPAGRIGNAKTAPITGGSPAEALRAGREAATQPEEPPVRVPQQGDPFAVAREQAKKKLAAAR